MDAISRERRAGQGLRVSAAARRVGLYRGGALEHAGSAVRPWRREPLFVPPKPPSEHWRPVRSKRGLSLTSPYANHLIRATAAVAGYADLEAADFPVKLAPGYMGAD
jgi:hypothetical protein